MIKWNKVKDLQFLAIRFNNDKLEQINVIKYIDFNVMRKKINYKGKKPNKYNLISSYDELKSFIRTELLYRFWCKSEHELLVSSFYKTEIEEKIDIFYQLEPNLDVITKYIMNELNIVF